MMFKTLTCAAVIALMPAVSFAFCSGKSHQAQSCAVGTVWDAATKSCVQQINS